MDDETETAVYNMSIELEEIKEYLADIAESLRVLAKRASLDDEPIIVGSDGEEIEGDEEEDEDEED